ncbi:MAG: LamG domain-containing protein [Phycisphaeraceae bacterium]|nr:LamG domain-containing protein [Phycisphaeraceae bacterium]MBX3367648.1 LamG domain-containing protein [Phycisphaeraceae bacterium]
MRRIRSAIFTPLIALAAGATLIALPALAAPPEYATSVTASNPLLWYRFDEASGNAINHGSLGSTFDATYNGTPDRSVATPGSDTGVGLGQGDWLESGGVSPLTGNPTFSIEAVVRLSEPGSASNWGPFLHWGSGNTGKEVYFSIQRNNNLRLYNGFYNAGVRSVRTFPGNIWLHVVWTRVGGNNSENGSAMYVNGYPIVTERDTNLSPGFLAPASIDVTGTTFRINEARNLIGNRYFTGTLDEVALYDRILTEEEIVARGTIFRCPADYNADIIVDILDFLDFFEDFGSCDQQPAPCGTLGDADFNGDTGVDILDFLDFFEAFGSGC